MSIVVCLWSPSVPPSVFPAPKGGGKERTGVNRTVRTGRAYLGRRVYARRRGAEVICFSSALLARAWQGAPGAVGLAPPDKISGTPSRIRSLSKSVCLEG